MIAKDKNELPCYDTASNPPELNFILTLLPTVLTAMVGGYTFVLHLCFKQLRNLFGMFYTFNVSIASIFGTIWVVLHAEVSLNSKFVCHFTIVGLHIFYLCVALSATCVLTQVGTRCVLLLQISSTDI